MKPESLPEGIITRFRTLSLERIARVETVWNALVQGADDEEATRAIARDLHTLKGDASIVGFAEVHVLAHKLEELFALAGQMNYRVSEDFDLVVTMATQFAAMLLRKRSGGASGIDLAGFVRQVDDVLRETQMLRRSKPTGKRTGGITAPPLTTDRLSEPVRRRLAIAATNAFVEYLSARQSASRVRLRSVWQSLSEELARLQTMALAGLVERHVGSTQTLSRELAKQVDIALALEDVRLESRVAEAVDLALVHSLRNAIDHGIEMPAAREAAGKNAQGLIQVRARETGGQVELTIEDDGGGVDLHAVRTKAVERGIVAADRVLSERELHDLVFQPGITTRDDVSDVSGRGVGMDAVKSAIVKAGGTVRFSSERGRGSTLVLTVPAPARSLRVFQFLAPGNAVNFAISARWTPSVAESDASDAIDPISALQLHGGTRQTLTGVAQPPRELVLRLRWGFLELAVRTSTDPQPATAERICPTPEDHPIEVVLIDGVEALLLRPEHISGMIRRAAEP